MNGTISMEEKLALLEARFSELEKKHAALVEDKTVDSSDAKDDSESKANGSNGDGEATKTWKGRVRVVTSKVDPISGARKDVDAEAESGRLGSGKEHALLLRKNLNEKEELNDGEIEIYDPGLRGLLKTLLAHYPRHTFIGDDMNIASPYEPFILNWNVLWRTAHEVCTDENENRTRSDLKELLHSILKGSGDAKLDSYLQVRDSFEKQRTITYEALWTIFPPGSLVYGQLFLKQDQIFIVEDNDQPWPWEDTARRIPSSKPNNWLLKCWTYDFTGKIFQRRAVYLSFESFTGIKPWGSLPYRPWNSLEPDEQSQIKQKLLKRGKLFRKYCTADENDRMYSYTGEAIVDKRGFRKNPGEDDSDSEDDLFMRLLRGRRREKPTRKRQMTLEVNKNNVMIDFDSYYRLGPEEARIGATAVSDDVSQCRCRECSKNEAQNKIFHPHYDSMKGDEDEEWEDLQLMLCPPRVLGYVLKEKQWAQLAVDSLQEIEEVEFDVAMKKLHLPSEEGVKRKELLHGLVKYHGMGQAKRGGKGYELDDIVANKGKGLVILLYGHPGVGKTSTAQILAHATRKPLLPIGVADVGTKAQQVESNLETIFYLANKWRALLLIDEADVFLQNRNNGHRPSAEGSALVSVFLRVLEYYHGILFLTTNQIAQFDIAVQSRIHIALKYEKLNKDQTRAIFLDFVGQYEAQGVVAKFNKIEEYAKNEFCNKRFDGRQIRNIVSSAMGYSRGQGKDKMSVESIREVVSYVEEFRDDLGHQMGLWQRDQDRTGVGI